MKEITVLRAQTAQVFKAGQLQRLPLFDLVEEIKDRYNFRTAPSPEQILQPAASAPARFVFGKFGKVTIETFEVLEAMAVGVGLAAACRTSTDDSGAFLDHLVGWLSTEYKIEREPIWPTQFQSQMEVVVEGSIAKRLEGFSSIGDAISRLLRGYGQAAMFEPIGISLHCDPGQTQIPIPGYFTFERRAGLAYDQNRYFSQSPLKTSDHKAVIEQIERLLR